MKFQEALEKLSGDGVRIWRSAWPEGSFAKWDAATLQRLVVYPGGNTFLSTKENLEADDWCWEGSGAAQAEPELRHKDFYLPSFANDKDGVVIKCEGTPENISLRYRINVLADVGAWLLAGEG